MADSYYSDPQYQAQMEMMGYDIGGLEKKQAQQQALATALRSQAMQPSSSKNWTAQLSRGLQGVGGALAQRGADKMSGTPGAGGAMADAGTIMGAKQRALQAARGVFSGQKKPLTMADDPSLAYSGQGGGGMGANPFDEF